LNVVRSDRTVVLKIVATIPVKNEAWILDRTLAALSEFCDAIVVADQGSTDGSREICGRFPKVRMIENPSERFNEAGRRKLLLEAARDLGGQNLVLPFDADEIPTGNVLGGSALQGLTDRMRPGGAAVMQWIMLWRDPFRYRDDTSVWSNNWRPFVYWDDRKVAFTDGTIHLSKVPDATLASAVRVDELKVLHYQFVLWDRMLSKQRFYRALERVLHPDKSPQAINNVYAITRDERDLTLREVPASWTQPWLDLGIDLARFEDEDLRWYEIEVLRFFAEHGPDRFAALDIWDEDWESKRLAAARRGVTGLPSEPIADPRNIEQRLYHSHIQRKIRSPSWRRWREKDPLAPARWLARRVGLRRSHFRFLRRNR
jgi:glycosyltransferase involved in cell wall biosynthesis